MPEGIVCGKAVAYWNYSLKQPRGGLETGPIRILNLCVFALSWRVKAHRLVAFEVLPEDWNL